MAIIIPGGENGDLKPKFSIRNIVTNAAYADIIDIKDCNKLFFVINTIRNGDNNSDRVFLKISIVNKDGTIAEQPVNQNVGWNYTIKWENRDIDPNWSHIEVHKEQANWVYAIYTCVAF